ncbi:MAG: hypothetical protein AAF685_16710, partial [Cyanobacteria bacterium P01_C01_bin.89]
RTTPILLVCHDADDGSWQFHTDQDAIISEAAIVPLRRIVEIDSSIRALHDLPLGWAARRGNTGAPWTRFEQAP